MLLVEGGAYAAGERFEYDSGSCKSAMTHAITFSLLPTWQQAKETKNCKQDVDAFYKGERESAFNTHLTNAKILEFKTVIPRDLKISSVISTTSSRGKKTGFRF